MDDTTGELAGPPERNPSDRSRERAERLWTGAAFDALAEIVVVLDSGGRVVHANRRAEELLQTTLEEWVGRSCTEVLHPDDVPLAAELVVTAQTGAEGPKEPVRYRLRASDGTDLPVAAIATKVVRDGRTFLVMSARPAVEPRPGAVIVDEVTERLARMFDEAAIGMAQVGLDGRFLRANPTLVDDLGIAAPQLLGIGIHDLVCARNQDEFARVWRRLVDGDEISLTTDVELATPMGPTHVHLAGSIVADRHGAPVYVAVQIVDVTLRVEAERALVQSQRQLRETQRELLHQSTHDPLTGLGNRLLLARASEQAGEVADRAEVAVIYLDLDGFKLVNDQYGHAVGDELLIAVAGRIRRFAGSADVAVRFGGDEFLLVQPCADLASAAEKAEELIASLAVPFALSVGPIAIRSSAGLVVGRPDGSWDKLIDRADALLYEAKRHRPGSVRAERCPSSECKP